MRVVIRSILFRGRLIGIFRGCIRSSGPGGHGRKEGFF